MKICQICHKPYSAVPALSRKDNKTLICPICATGEALDAAGIIEGSKLRDDILQMVSKGYADQGINVPIPGGEQYAERDHSGAFLQKLH